MLVIKGWNGFVIVEDDETARRLLGSRYDRYEIVPAVLSKASEQSIQKEVVKQFLLWLPGFDEASLAGFEAMIAQLTGASAEDVHAALEQAMPVIEALIPPEVKMAPEELATYLLKKHNGDRIAAIKAFRENTDVDLIEARDRIFAAAGLPTLRR